MLYAFHASPYYIIRLKLCWHNRLKPYIAYHMLKSYWLKTGLLWNSHKCCSYNPLSNAKPTNCNGDHKAINFDDFMFSSAICVYFSTNIILHYCNFSHCLAKFDLKYFHQHPHLILLPTFSLLLIMLAIIWINIDFKNFELCWNVRNT